MTKVSVKFQTVGKWKENTYLIEYQNETWLIDPGDDFEKLNNSLPIAKSCLKGIVGTHGHFDHIGAIHDFKEKYQVPFYIHSKDKQLVSQGNLYRRLAGESTIRQTPKVDFYLDDLNVLNIGDKQIRIHHTPGHTNGSICLEIDNILISGDLLFSDNIGRTDLPGGNKSLLLKSVEFIIENFKGFTVYPGHESPYVLDDNKINKISSFL